MKTQKETTDGAEEKKPRKRKPYPTSSFEESFELAKEVYKLGAGQKVRRLTVFDALKKSPDSGPSRMLVTSVNKYGLVTGGYQAEFLELTQKGKEATSDEVSESVRSRAKFQLAIENIEIYKKLYDKFVDAKLPNLTVMKDILMELEPELEDDEASTVVDTFVVNIKFLGLLQTIAGAERLISIDHSLEKLPALRQSNGHTIDLVEIDSTSKQITQYKNFENVCFYITPIGEESSEHRKHADLFLESIIEPALKTLNLTVVRADKIEKPGIITKQIIEYIIKSKLVIADLSYHNPNVFYELALRHACRLPTVQIIRKADRIPFDLSQSRTIVIDTTDIYALVPKIETYKSEISNQARQALSDPDSVDNPITQVFPKLTIKPD